MGGNLSPNNGGLAWTGYSHSQTDWPRLANNCCLIDKVRQTQPADCNQSQSACIDEQHSSAMQLFAIGNLTQLVANWSTASLFVDFLNFSFNSVSFCLDPESK